jgi:hypothetical protein
LAKSDKKVIEKIFSPPMNKHSICPFCAINTIFQCPMPLHYCKAMNSTTSQQESLRYPYQNENDSRAPSHMSSKGTPKNGDYGNKFQYTMYSTAPKCKIII